MIVNPSLWGGANWPPSSYDPERRVAVRLRFVGRAGYFIGGDRDVRDAARTASITTAASSASRRCRASGIFAALDVTTNTLRWRYRWPDQCYSGSVATGGGLVFVGRNDGRLTALDSATGKQLWEFQTGAGMNAGASTVRARGQAIRLAYSAGNCLIGSARGDSVWLFGFDGTLPPATPRDSERPTTSTVAPAPCIGLSLGAGGRGRRTVTRCMRRSASRVTARTARVGTAAACRSRRCRPIDFAVDTVTYGRNNMPPFGSSLSTAQIRAVSEYVVADIAHSK